MRLLLRLLISSLCFVGNAWVADAAAAKPNLVIFLADDLGYGDLGSRDLAAEHPDLVKRLRDQMAGFERSLKPR